MMKLVKTQSANKSASIEVKEKDGKKHRMNTNGIEASGNRGEEEPLNNTAPGHGHTNTLNDQQNSLGDNKKISQFVQEGNNGDITHANGNGDKAPLNPDESGKGMTHTHGVSADHSHV